MEKQGLKIYGGYAWAEESLLPGGVSPLISNDDDDGLVSVGELLVLKVLLIHVAGECKTVLKASSPDIRGWAIIPEAEQTLSSRTPHRINLRLGI